MSRAPHLPESPLHDTASPSGLARKPGRRLAAASERGHGDEERRLAERRITDRRGEHEPVDRPRLGGNGPADVPAPSPASSVELQALLDSVSDPLYVVDRHWRLRYLNAAAARDWGRDLDTALGQVLWTVYPPLLGEGLHDRLVDAMRERRAVRVEVFAATLGAWIAATAYPAGDGLLVLHHRGSTSQTDTRHLLDAERAARAESEQQREEAQRLAAELRTARETADGVRRAAERARADAEAAARTKSDFLATMSHELRTPINAITGYTQLLDLGVAGPVTDAQRSYLSRLHASGRHLLGLVDDVLDLANLERGQINIARDRLTTGSVVAAALALIAPDAAARSIRLLDERSGVEELAFIGDEHRVRQILLNLLSNAVKFTVPGGSVAVGCNRIVRRARSGGAPSACVCISVRDTGIGIDPEQQGAIFEPFTQADSSHTRTAGGTGLGLAISRRLARLMQGDLTVESRLGSGSTFTLLLPVDPAEPPHQDGSESESGGTSPVALESVVTGATPMGDIGASSEFGATDAVPIAEVGARLREQLEPLLDAFVGRLRTDPTFGAARILSRAQLEDHTLSMLGAVVHALVVIEEGGGLEGELLRDGSAIQEHIAFCHGEQRFRLGWAEPMLDREYAILGEEITALARRIVREDSESTRRLLDVLQRLLDRARQVSARGYQHARRFGHP